jgi:hypothetical protein
LVAKFTGKLSLVGIIFVNVNYHAMNRGSGRQAIFHWNEYGPGVSQVASKFELELDENSTIQDSIKMLY